MRKPLGWLAIIFLFLVPLGSAQTAPADGDHDGLADSLEAALLDQFHPSFLISKDDCDLLPAEMVSGEARPRVRVRNGTIYGQATPHTPDGVELHYFHLWLHDCGRRGHRGDVEHVSALIRQEKDGAWKAQYWYAAAHEDTVCNRSMFARAQELQAVDMGPEVWISAGKHASYFSAEHCNGGCGGDSCAGMRPAPALPVINLGEPGAPLNGAAWMNSSSLSWPLAAKMSSDFEPGVIAQLEALPANGPVRISSSAPGMQRAIAVSNTTVGSLETAQGHTENGLETATRKTSNALERSYRAVKLWMRRNSGSR
jgi:hypothetical protein